ncbi:probable G-protein coupled receptor Mth-like 3 [Octopus sinensis]|uniref:Probable G-protein coupled receptor Mth-like 3 n=1 Tax=Octopus sinensis TaxID=2607531 RepID=A0A6P7SUL1_9MOLL|nr:probable G-protein coupled receptor Mth-like 3 [Octopus sinensis]
MNSLWLCFLLLFTNTSLSLRVTIPEVNALSCSDVKCESKENRSCVCGDFHYANNSYSLEEMYDRYVSNFNLIKNCSEEYVDDKRIREKCESKSNSSLFNVYVTSLKTAKVYGNKYCALCNKEDDFIFWNLRINNWDCLNYIKYPNITFNTFNTSKCEYIFEHPPFPFDINRCPKTIDCCCNDQKEKALNESSRVLFYENLCCNSYSKPVAPNFEFKYFTRDKISFGILIDFNGENFWDTNNKRKRDNLCPENSVFDHYLGKCRKSYDANRITKNDRLNCTTLIELNSTEYFLLENQTLFHNATESFHSQDFYIINNSRVYICQERVLNSPRYGGTIILTESEFYVSLIGTMISVIALAVFFIMYLVLPPLRNLSGQINASFALSLFIADSCFLIVLLAGELPGFCHWFAVCIQYSFLASFFWMNVISISVCISICHRTAHHVMLLNKNRTFLLCSLYAWFTPLLIIMPALLLDKYDPTSKFAPQYGRGTFCWMNTPLSILIFFDIPMAVIIFINIIVYIRTASEICKARAVIKTQPRKQTMFTIIINMKLCCLTGAMWIFGYISITSDVQFLRTLYVLLNATFGLWVACCFLCTKTVANLTKEKIKSVTASAS